MDLSKVDQQWLALQVRPKAEFIVSSILRQKGYEEFLPTYTVLRREQIRKPLFPGYIFCKYNKEVREKFITTPGIVRILGSGVSPNTVLDEEIHRIRNIVERCCATPCPFTKIGQRVVIGSGPLLGISGILTSYARHRKLVVSIDLLQRSILVAIEPSWITELC